MLFSGKPGTPGIPGKHGRPGRAACIGKLFSESIDHGCIVFNKQSLVVIREYFAIHNHVNYAISKYFQDLRFIAT